MKNLFVLLLLLVTSLNYGFSQKSIGETHNQDILTIVNSLNFTGKETKQERIDAVNKAVVKFYGKPLSSITTFNKSEDPYVLLRDLKGKISDNLYNLVSTDIDFLKTNSLESVKTRLNSQKGDNLSTSEKGNYNDFKSVLISSSELWQSDKVGQIIGVLNPPLVTELGRISWWKVIACDAVGGIGGAILGAVPGAIVGAVVASACSAINQY
jgi:hypothetical protein